MAKKYEDRISTFDRPTSKKKIIGDRNIIYVDNFYDIASAHESRKADEVVVIGPDVHIIPKGQYYSAQNYSKRGPLVELNTYSRRQDMEQMLIRSEWSPIKARIEASEKYKGKRDEHYVGWLWFDPEKKAHIVHPTTVLEGHRLHMHALQSADIGDKVELPKGDDLSKSYHAADSNLRTQRARVPSKSGGKKYDDVLLEHVTDLNDPQRFVEWTRMSTRHMCKHKQEDFSFKFSDYVTYCSHDVAAHATYSRRVAEEKHRVVFQPFPLFSEPMLGLHMGLIHDTMKLDVVVDGSKINTRLKPLSLPQIDPILMDTWLKHGNKKTFWVGAPTKGYKKMRDYNWESGGEGMGFSA